MYFPYRSLSAFTYSRKKKVRVIVSYSTYAKLVYCSALRNLTEDSYVFFLVGAVKMDETDKYSLNSALMDDDKRPSKYLLKSLLDKMSH